MLVNDNLAALAARGARTLAGVRAQLDGGVALVELAGHPDRARKGLVSLWELELALLLQEHPEAAAELRQFIAEIGPALPVEPHWRCTG